MQSLLEQIKLRRLALAFKQHDMKLRLGISRQQYQRLESKGNPRLNTLELIAKGLNCELVLVPVEKLDAVQAILADDSAIPGETRQSAKDLSTQNSHTALNENPWQGLLGENE